MKITRKDDSVLAVVDFENSTVEIAHPMERIQITFEELRMMSDAVDAELISRQPIGASDLAREIK